MGSVGTEDDAAVGRRVRELRERSGKSQAEVSDALARLGASGFYPQTIAKLESGNRSLKLHEAAKLAEAIDANLGELLNATPRNLKREMARQMEIAVKHAYARAVEAAFMLERRRRILSTAVEGLGDSQDSQAHAHTLTSCTPEAAASEGREAVDDPEKHDALLGRINAKRDL